MGTPWDRAADRYLDEWVPRFVPYLLDLVRELALTQGQRVLVTCAGPGSEALAAARVVGERGLVRATDPSAEMVRLCERQAQKAGLPAIACEQASPDDVGAGGWNAIVCAFGLWLYDDRPALLQKWAGALTPAGKVGVLTWGPADESDPFEILNTSLRELEPTVSQRRARIDADRNSMAQMFEAAGLSLVRHTQVRHTLSFASAEAFFSAATEGRTWRPVVEELGAARMARVAARFYDHVGGPTEPLSFEPTATLAIAAPPGAEVELAVRPSLRAPNLASAPPPKPSKPIID